MKLCVSTKRASSPLYIRPDATGAWFEKDGMPLFTPLSIGSGLHFWGPMERKKEIFNDLMERVARDCKPASAELYILVCAGWNLVPGLQKDGQAARGAASIEVAADRGSDISGCAADVLSVVGCAADCQPMVAARVLLLSALVAFEARDRRVLLLGGDLLPWIRPAVRRRGRAAAVPAVEASHLQHRSSTGGAALDRCAVAIHGVVPQRGSLRVWQPGVDLGPWLRDKQHELGIQMQWACWERAIGEKFEDWSAAAGGVRNPPFLVVALPSRWMDLARFQPEGLIVCAPRHPLMAELAHDVIHPARSGARIGRSVREHLQDEICRFEPERLSPGWHISKAYGYVYLVDLAEFRRHGLATTTWRSAESPAAGAGLSLERGLGSRVRAKSGEWT